MIAIDPSTLPARDVYRILVGAIVPRPIAFVSTLSADGRGNLAPFSFFNGVSSNPPCLMFSVTRSRGGGKKDTLRNIEETGQFVVNTVSESMAVPMNQCSAEYEYGVDEMSEVGLTPLDSSLVKPRRVAESPVHFECETYRLVEIGDGSPGSATIVIGRILMIHVLPDAYDSGKLRIDALRPLSRLGGASYGRTSGVFDLPRPTRREI